ncbi:UPF0187-domain-containing protein [Roridomyces roridus]|uniref:UPF0187-domain-containing protein n=1 Tax=Roridomyces roridus TaxID=1738132 RepID=A0AAD7FFI8_9AGAR|nr:UPF0187-domain-containing protein [Roridomyces roridus]
MMPARSLNAKRSFTGNHSLLPAMRPTAAPFIPKIPTYTRLRWTFGRGSVVWKIWPAVLLHTLFATLIVYLWKSMETMLRIPNVMLTVMGVVIGFVISYRASSGYDRYWLGRTAWADVIRNVRTTGRLVWYHIPPRLTPGPLAGRSPQEMGKVMAEKRMALDLLEAFAVALKHHLRGEVGIYYEDLYHLVRPLHDFTDPNNPRPTVASAVEPLDPPPAAPVPVPPTATSGTSSGVDANKSTTHASKRPSALTVPAPLPATPGPLPHFALLPAADPARQPQNQNTVLSRVDPDVIPFAGFFAGLVGWVRGWWKDTKRDMEDGDRWGDLSSRMRHRMRTWSGPVHPHQVAELEEVEKGENLPEEILRCLSEWLSVLEERATVPGSTMGNLMTSIQQFEASLTTLEQILTTPLPFVYSVHIRHVVWMYLFLLPLQLVSDFGWHTVPAVCVGAFVYLGFVAAGEEIEQPFGYDDNDLDLDMFCRDIIKGDIDGLKKTPCQNAWFPPGATSILSARGAGESEVSVADALSPADESNSADERITLTGFLGSGPDETSDALHAYGGNMYRASLSSLADTLDISGKSASIGGEGESLSGTETETEGDGGAGGQEGHLVDL